MLLPLPIAGAQQQARGLAARPSNKQATPAPERIAYDPGVDGNTAAFRRSPRFQTFATQYKATLNELKELVDTYILDTVRATQLKNNLGIFEEKLLVNHTFSDNQTCTDLYIVARQNLEEIVERLPSADISDVDKISAIERALTEIHECSPGLSSGLENANRELKYAAQGHVGACKKMINQQLDAQAQAFSEKVHGHESSYLTHETHYVNGYKNQAVRAYFENLPTTKDGSSNIVSSLRNRSNVPLFLDQIAVSMTPRSVLNGLTDTYCDAISSVLSDRDLDINTPFSELRLDADLLQALNKAVMPLKFALPEDQREGFDIQRLMKSEEDDADGFQSYSFTEVHQTIRGILANHLKNELAELCWPQLREQPEEIVRLKDGRSIHHDQGVLFSIKSTGSQEMRGPRIEDLKSLDLASWPAPLMSDLAQQAIDGATSFKELGDFSLQHLMPSSTFSSYLHPRQTKRDKALKSKLTQAVQAKLTADPNLRNNLASEIGKASSEKELKPLRPLIGNSTQAKVAYVNKAHELGLPSTNLIRSYLCEMDVLSLVPAEHIARVFAPHTSSELLERAIIKGHESAMDKLVSVPNIDINYSQDLPPEGNGNTLLITACEKGGVAVDKLLGHPKINVNEANAYHREMPFQVACKNGHVDAIEKLVKHPGFSCRDFYYGFSAVNDVCKNGNAAMLETLLEQYPDINVNGNRWDVFEVTPLVHATQKGDEAMMKILLKSPDIDVGLRDIYGKTALDYATEAGNETLVDLLKESLISETFKSGSKKWWVTY